MQLAKIQGTSNQAVAIQELTGRTFVAGTDGIDGLRYNETTGLIEILRRGTLHLLSPSGWLMTVAAPEAAVDDGQIALPEVPPRGRGRPRKIVA